MKNALRPGRLSLAAIVVMIAIALGGTAQAQIPELITYQGRLSNVMMMPVNGCLDMTFRIYDSPGMAAPVLWFETHATANCVLVTNGPPRPDPSGGRFRC